MSNPTHNTETIPACCAEGAIHSGTLKGSVELVHGLQTYVSPAAGGDGTKASGKPTTIVFLSDAFGLSDGYPNPKLLADEYAAKGYRVLLPDLFNGDPLPAELLVATATAVPDPKETANKGFVGRWVTKFTVTRKLATVGGPWLFKHRDSVTRPIIDNFLKAVRDDPTVGHVATVGFCFGGRYALLSAAGAKPAVDARVSIPTDLKDIVAPALLVVGDEDEWMKMVQVQRAITVFDQLKLKNTNLKVEVKVYEGAKHGFAIRGHLETEKERALRERALEDGLSFLTATGM